MDTNTRRLERLTPSSDSDLRRAPRAALDLAVAGVGLGGFLLFTLFPHLLGLFPLTLGLIFVLLGAHSPYRLAFQFPGCVFAGLGAGAAFEIASGTAGFTSVGIGLGFVAIWALNPRQWGWLPVGAFWATAGLRSALAYPGGAALIAVPLALLLGSGGWQLVQAYRQGHRVLL